MIEDSPRLLADAARQPMPPGVVFVIVCMAVLSGVIPLLLRVYGDRRATRMLASWASEQRYELVSQRVISSMRGPFRMRGYWTTVFIVKVRLPGGEEKMGFLCMNNFFVWGGGKPDVAWDA